MPTSIFDSSLFDYASAGIPGEKSKRILTGGKTAFSTALKEDILSKLPKSVTQAGGGADVIDIIKEFCPSLEIEYVSNEIMNQLSYEVSNQKFKDTGFIFEGEMKKRIYETLSLLGKINNDEKFL